MLGSTWLKLKPTIIVDKKTVKTCPDVYLLTVSSTGQWWLPSMHWEPYQKARAYPSIKLRFKEPKLSPISIPNLMVDYLSSRHYLYFPLSYSSPLSILMVFIEENACSALPPAFVYYNLSLTACFWIIFIQMKAVRAVIGITTKTTKASSHPFTKETTIPEITNEIK